MQETTDTNTRNKSRHWYPSQKKKAELDRAIINPQHRFNNHSSNEEGVVHPLGERHGGQLGAVGVDFVPGELAAVRVEVDVLGAQPALALPQPAAEPEKQYDGGGEVGLEEALGVVDAAFDGCDGNIELICTLVNDILTLLFL